MSERVATPVPVSYCPACSLNITDPFPYCFACGSPTEDRVLEVDVVEAYVATTTTTGEFERTLVFVDLADDVRVLADAPRPVRIGERGRISVTGSTDGTDHYAFHPLDDEEDGR
ncbi:hypothetical protein [Nocardioides sp. R-C-SC26]|uniref:hypothetical protein n=1 Tax=Nocardioides sp. R-C-SC26 TaxID=2870414 RepID=UPI001E29066E|nr:hypothetical protein [Nocardioides sp. R-C-SC26]